MERRSPVASLNAAQMLHRDVKILGQRRLGHSGHTSQSVQISADRREQILEAGVPRAFRHPGTL